VAGKTVQSLVDTVQPKSFGDEYRTHYKALYKCPVYFLYLELKTKATNYAEQLSNRRKRTQDN